MTHAVTKVLLAMVLSSTLLHAKEVAPEACFQVDVVIAMVGQNVSLECIVNPSHSIHMEWSHERESEHNMTDHEDYPDYNPNSTEDPDYVESIENGNWHLLPSVQNVSNAKLFIERVTQEQEGHYKCNATDEKSNKSSQAKVYLRVCRTNNVDCSGNKPRKVSDCVIKRDPKTSGTSETFEKRGWYGLVLTLFLGLHATHQILSST